MCSYQFREKLKYWTKGKITRIIFRQNQCLWALKSFTKNTSGCGGPE
jgi:hypothetical protein